MTRDELLRIIKAAAEDMKTTDLYLLSVGVGEECISHKFAQHLEERGRLLPDWNTQSLQVDCEYNRYGIDPKSIPKRFSTEGDRGKTFPYPDVIVHRRGPGGPNILAVEVKKSNNATGPRGKRDVQYAKWKLREYRGTLKYHFSLYICFYVGEWVVEAANNPDWTCYSELQLLPEQRRAALLG